MPNLFQVTINISLSYYHTYSRVFVFAPLATGSSLLAHTGKRTEWSPIRSVITSDLLITSMITDRHRTTQSPLTN